MKALLRLQGDLYTLELIAEAGEEKRFLNRLGTGLDKQRAVFTPDSVANEEFENEKLRIQVQKHP